MQAIQEILERLKSTSWWTRKSAIDALLSYSPESYLGVLDEWLRNDQEDLLRNAAMEAYRSLGEKATPSLIHLLTDDNPDVRIFSANLLGDIGDSSAVHGLLKAIRDPEMNVQSAAIEALGKIADQSAVGALKQAITEDPWIAMSAIEALGKIGGTEAVAFLHGLLESEDFRMITVDALKYCGTAETLILLKPLLNDDTVGTAVLDAIVSIVLKEGIVPAGDFLSGYVDYLMDLVSSPEREVKRNAFIALSWIPDRKILPVILEGIGDEELQEYAIQGVLNFGDAATSDILLVLEDNARKDRVVLAKLLSMIGRYESLLAFASDDDPEVRTEVALACGMIDDESAREKLTRMLEDSSEEVREVAAQELRRSAL